MSHSKACARATEGHNSGALRFGPWDLVLPHGGFVVFWEGAVSSFTVIRQRQTWHGRVGGRTW